MNKGANNSYWGNIKDAISSLFEGLRLSLRHLWQARESRTPIGIEDKNYFDQHTGIVTLQYPNESFPVPDNGRYRLHNEIEDCIVCDKCAKICPVNCIEIEPVRAIDEDLGKTSDGTPKRIHAAKFDIDMGKCCFCGLCTTVCPTECLTMTKVYDFTEFDVADHIYSFAEMTPLEILEKKQKLEAYNQEKEKAVAAKKSANEAQENSGVAKPKPTFKPRVKKSGESQDEVNQSEETSAAAPKPSFKPKIKPVVKREERGAESRGDADTVPPSASPKLVFRPKMKPTTAKGENTEKSDEKNPDDAAKASSAAKPKPVFRPRVKPVVKKEMSSEDFAASKTREGEASPAEKPKPVFRPKIKPVIKKDVEGTTPGEESREEEGPISASKLPRPVFKPKIKPKKDDDEGANE